MKKQKTKKKRNLIADILNFSGQLILVLIILLCIPLSVPRLFGYEVYNVISGSMEPTIPVGSLVYIKHMDATEIAVEDVIAFYSPNNPEATITHRVIEKDDSTREFITKGDANAQEDLAPIPYEYLVGRVELSLPYLGNILSGFVNGNGKMAVIGLVVLSVVLQIAAMYLPKGKKKKALPKEEEITES